MEERGEGEREREGRGEIGRGRGSERGWRRGGEGEQRGQLFSFLLSFAVQSKTTKGVLPAFDASRGQAAQPREGTDDDLPQTESRDQSLQEIAEERMGGANKVTYVTDEEPL